MARPASGIMAVLPAVDRKIAARGWVTLPRQDDGPIAR